MLILYTFSKKQIKLYDKLSKVILFFLFQVIQKNQNLTTKTSDAPSAAILAIYLDQGYELPVSLPPLPSTRCVLSVSCFPL